MNAQNSDATTVFDRGSLPSHLGHPSSSQNMRNGFWNSAVSRNCRYGDDKRSKSEMSVRNEDGSITIGRLNTNRIANVICDLTPHLQHASSDHLRFRYNRQGGASVASNRTYLHQESYVSRELIFLRGRSSVVQSRFPASVRFEELRHYT